MPPIEFGLASSTHRARMASHEIESIFRQADELSVFHRALLFSLIVSSGLSFGATNAVGQTRLRRPQAITVVGDTAFIANRESGSVSRLNIPRRSITAETDVGAKLADIISCPDNVHLLAIDEAKAELVVLRHRQQRLEIVTRIETPPYPVTVSISPDGKRCAVASLWPRQLTLFTVASLFDPQDTPCAQTIDLQIAPRTQCWLSNERLIVADSFGGRMTVIDAGSALPCGRLVIEGHNIRGLALNADRTHLFMTHQVLNGQEATTRSRVFWGDVMGNLLRSIAVAHIEELCDHTASTKVPEKRIAHWMFHPLGEPSNAAGDPGAVLVNQYGQTAVLLSGTNEVALRSGDFKVFTRKPVGRRPVTGALTPCGEMVVIANYFDDSISLVSLTDKTVMDTISLGKQPELTLAQQGEALFYDAHLSLDKWYSCHSCHTDGHTTGLVNDNFSDGTYGAPKRILSLLGASQTAPWAWNGSQTNLSDQVSKSIEITMQGQADATTRQQAAEAIAAYLDTLAPPPSVAALRGSLDAAAIDRGRAIFRSVGCQDCHQPDFYTARETYDIGSSDDDGVHAFNPPSLLGLSQRSSLLHDASAANVHEVFASTDHGALTESLDVQAVQDLVAFLGSL